MIKPMMVQALKGIRGLEIYYVAVFIKSDLSNIA
jgi:hypothetical protein